MVEIEINKWYLSVECTKCRRGLPFQEAPEDPEASVPFPNELRLTCDACGYVGTYHQAQARRSRSSH